MTRGTYKDLKGAGNKAREYLKMPGKGYRHIVYAYVEKANPSAIVVLNHWEMHYFTSDEAFMIWLHDLDEDEVEMIYAVHSI